ncbi:MAG: ATPase [Verrucomicrobia bacterium]|nr:ATPase [Verrucomicrobiota bacterium]
MPESSDTRICSRCVLPGTTPGIRFDSHGVCNYCIGYQPMTVLGENELRAILERQKQRSGSKQYDCIVGLSGGRDSTYVLWMLVKKYGMRVLAVHYHNPFTSEQALKNIERASTILSVPVLRWQYPAGAQERATRKAIRVWAKNPSSKLIPLVCAHCKSWWFEYFRICRQHGIDLMVIGSNPLETASFKKEGFGGARTYHKLSNIPKMVYRAGKEVLSNPSLLTLSWPLTIRMYLGASHSTPYMRYRYKDISVIRLFDYIKWNETEVERTISQELEWRRSDEVPSSWRFDCRLDYARRLMYASTIGVTELQDLFSKMIREGILSRDDALARLERENHVPAASVERVLGELGLTLDALKLRGCGDYLT